MVLRLQLRVDNAPGVPLMITAWFADKKEKWLKGMNEVYRAKGDILSTRCYVTPKYDQTEFKETELFVPYEEFQFTPGEHEVLYKMTVRRSDDQKLVFQSLDWNRSKIVATSVPPARAK